MVTKHMKKTNILFLILFFVFIVYSIVNITETNHSSMHVLLTFSKTILPALLPFLILNQLIIKLGIIDLISQNAKEQVGGEASEYRKVLLTDALGAYGNFNGKHRMEDGRNAVKDYRYPHEYLTAWVLASKLLGGNDEKMIQLAMAVQKKCNHIISFDKIAEATSQTMKDVADVLNVEENTLKKMEECVGYVYKSKKNEQLIQQNYCPDR